MPLACTAAGLLGGPACALNAMRLVDKAFLSVCRLNSRQRYYSCMAQEVHASLCALVLL